jgi:hypothetical protein
MRRRTEAVAATNLEWFRTEFIASFMLAVNDVASRRHAIQNLYGDLLLIGCREGLASLFRYRLFHLCVAGWYIYEERSPTASAMMF